MEGEKFKTIIESLLDFDIRSLTNEQLKTYSAIIFNDIIDCERELYKRGIKKGT